MDIDRKEIEFVTQISQSGYGLPMIIWGLIGLFPPVWGFVVIPLLKSFNISQSAIDAACLGSLSLLIALAIYLTVLSLRFYSRTYGRVRLEKAERRKLALRYCLYVAPVLVGFTLGVLIDQSFGPPVSLSLLCFAGFSFVLWFVKGRGISNHHLWLGMIILLLSAFPLFGFVQNGAVYGFGLLDYYTVLSGIYGLIVVADGFFDHLKLVRTLRPLPKEDGYEFV